MSQGRLAKLPVMGVGQGPEGPSPRKDRGKEEKKKMFHVRIGGRLQKWGRAAPGFEGMEPLALFSTKGEAEGALERARAAVASWAAAYPDTDRARRGEENVEVVECPGSWDQGLFGKRCNCR